MTLVTIMTSTDHRERTTPFGIPGRHLARQRNPNFFLVAINLFFCWFPLHFLHFCTIGRSTSSRNKGIWHPCYFKITPWHSWHFGIFKVCKGIIPEKCWLTLPHFLHFLHFGGRKCRKCRKCKQISSFFLFAAPCSLGLGQPYIYTPALNQTKNPKMMTAEKRRTLRCRSESPSKCAKVSRMPRGKYYGMA